MRDIGKNPALYGLRSIRQGASTRARATKMPDIFLRASGGWKGRAMDAYSKDCLPGHQKQFARALGQIPTPQETDATTASSRPYARSCSDRPGRAGVYPGKSTPRRTPSSYAMKLRDS